MGVLRKWMPTSAAQVRYIFTYWTTPAPESPWIINKKNVAESQTQQNLNPQIESAINNITSSEFMAYYFYEQMAWYFNRDSVALPGFHAYFQSRADDLMKLARKFMEYQNKRGGRIILGDIPAYPKQDGWTPLEAMDKSIFVEHGIKQHLLKQNELAESLKDSQFSGFLSNFLNEQVIDLKEMTDHVTQLKRVGPGIGEYLYDKDSIMKESYFDKINRDNY
ncbi:unnamed protein product [Medioppia subpectinata]|uniref:Ferritin n=1 Tax=Medioppia subpectinata TaxID=1979941 RepID=A0A7R9Q5C4_9ACAR|nr:unnamed protein product [Medioppia subpectinata]CAG2113175.1 unnamed protein product [Medioppia subpectinata]